MKRKEVFPYAGVEILQTNLSVTGRIEKQGLRVGQG